MVILCSEFFDVSIDYLVYGKEKSPKSDLTDLEHRALMAFRNLTPEDKLIEIGHMEGISEKYTPEEKENVS